MMMPCLPKMADVFSYGKHKRDLKRKDNVMKLKEETNAES